MNTPAAWLETRDGERVDCLVERVSRHRWQAVPVRDLRIDEVAAGHVDVLPAGHAVSFVIAGDDDDDDE